MSQFTMLTTFSKTERPFTAIMLKSVQQLDALYKNFVYLGAGEYGSVFSAFRKLDNERVALKISQTHIAVLQNEWKILKLLDKGKGVPAAYRMIVTRQSIGCLEMELLTLTLKDYISKYKPPQQDLYRLTSELVDILEFVHSKGVVHRDIKPENIMIKNPSATPILYLIDYGLAEVAGEEKPPIAFVGTLRFCSIKAHLIKASTNQNNQPSQAQPQAVGPIEDLETAMYSMAFFLKNTLPWLKFEDDNSNVSLKKNQDIMTSKTNDFPTSSGPVFSKAIRLISKSKDVEKGLYLGLRTIFYDEEKENSVFEEDELEKVSLKVVQLDGNACRPKFMHAHPTIKTNQYSL